MLPDCLYILLPLQVDHGQAVEGKIKDWKGKSRENQGDQIHALVCTGPGRRASLQHPTPRTAVTDLAGPQWQGGRKPEPLPLTQHG